MKTDERDRAVEPQSAASPAVPAPPAPGQTGLPDKVKDVLAAVRETASTGSGQHLPRALAQCLDAVLSLIQTTVANIRPISEHTLPSVTLTLSAMIRATETVAHKVLDEAEGLTAEQRRLSESLARLGRFVDASDLNASAALVEATEAGHAFSARLVSIVSAMEFQDLMAQHLAATIKAIEGVQEGLLEILGGMDLPVGRPAELPVRLQERIGAPAASAPWRQALADQVLADPGRE